MPLVQCGRVLRALRVCSHFVLCTLPVLSVLTRSLYPVTLFVYYLLSVYLNSFLRCWTLSWLNDCSTYIFCWLNRLPSYRPHVMYQPRLRSKPRLAPRQHSGSATSTTKDSSSMALGPTASPSKVSPHLASLPPLLRSRSPSPPLSQPPQHRARSITSPPQSNGTLGPGPATPCKLSRKESGPIWRRKRLNRELYPHSPLGTGLTSYLTSLRMICVGQTKISLLRRIIPAPSPGNISRLPYICMA